MGYNIAGFITNNQLNNIDKLQDILNIDLEYLGEVDGDDATIAKFDSDYDVYNNSRGSIVLLQMGQVYDFFEEKGDFIQFIVSDVSDTYYFEKFKDGKLERKLIISQGEIAENQGDGIINENDDFMDKVLDVTNEILGVDDFFGLTFKRFKTINN